ncbi:MAG: hypothetical protein VW080_01340 [Flavobacteriaceae bacterium]
MNIKNFFFTFFMWVAILGCTKDKNQFSLTIKNPWNFEVEVSSNSFAPVQVEPDGEITLMVDYNPNGVSIWTDDPSGTNDIDTIDSYSSGFTTFQPEAGKAYNFYAGYPDVFEKMETQGDAVAGAACNEDYKRASPDIQLDAHCQAAYVYYCAGGSEAVATYCQSFKQAVDALWNGVGERPTCSYCD